MRRFLAPSLTLFLLLALAACGSEEQPAPADGETAAPGELVVYAGRSQALVEPIVDRFREETGIDVQVRYGRDAELLAALEEEGDRSAADLFWANTSGALGAANTAGLLTQLPDSLLGMPAAFVPSSGLWVPVTTRFRVLAYHPQRVDAASLPASVLDLPELDALRGRIGWTPTYSSFQDFVTAMEITYGTDTTRTWLEGMKDLEPKAYSSNTPMLEALAAGEIDVALTNHYYVLRVLHGGEEGEEMEGSDAPVAIHRFAPGDVGNLALVTGAGVLATATHRDNALLFLNYLLSAETQTAAAETVFEYPVVRSARLPAYFMPFDEALQLGPDLDFERLRDMDGTLRLLRDEDLL
ncbi:MAG: extracellular solute-binding protein [Rhodothermales bacterium]